MEPDAPEEAVARVMAFLVSSGFDVHRSSGEARTLLGIVGDVSGDDLAVVRELPAVAEVVRISEPFRLASRRFRRESTIVEGAWGRIGGDSPWIAAELVGSDDDEPLRTDRSAGRLFDAAVVRRRRSPETLGGLTCLTVHAAPQEPRWPVQFVERQPSWGAYAWLSAAEKQLERQEVGVVLLESGGEYPNGARTLEVAAIARVKERSHLPIVVDVPTIAQRARYCATVAGAAIGAGAAGVILRVWVGADAEFPRFPATLSWDEAIELADKLRRIGAVVRR